MESKPLNELIELAVDCGYSQITYVHRDAALNIIKDYALRHNWGMFRHWEIDGVEYYDCGPRTFTIKSR